MCSRSSTSRTGSCRAGRELHIVTVPEGTASARESEHNSVRGVLIGYQGDRMLTDYEDSLRSSLELDG